MNTYLNDCNPRAHSQDDAKVVLQPILHTFHTSLEEKYHVWFTKIVRLWIILRTILFIRIIKQDDIIKLEHEYFWNLFYL